MKKQKILLVGICATIGLSSLFGCGSSNSSSKNASVTSSDSSGTEETEESGTVEYYEYQWPRSDIAAIIPQPKSKIGRIVWEDSSGFMAYISETSKSDYNDYVNACWDAGFTEDYTKSEDYFWAYNKDEYEISVQYEDDEDGNKVMYISINEPIKNTSSSNTESESLETEEAETSSVVSKTESKTEESSASSETESTGIRPEIKEAIDSYETFMNEYCDFMEKYNESDDVSSMLTEYADYMKKYADCADKFDKLEEDDLNTEETKYYIDVQARVSKRLIETSNNMRK